jgi:hypothetical protein
VDLLKGLQLDVLRSTISDKILELQAHFIQPTDVVNFTPRLNTRIAHLRCRIQHLEAMALHAGEVDSASIHTLGEKFDAVESRMSKVYAERPPINLGAGNSSDLRSTAGPSLNQITPEVMQQQAQVMAEVRMPSFNSGQVFPGKLYQKLPHPLAPFKNLPVSDGRNIKVLYDLLKVIKLRQVGLIVEPTLFELLYPCCQGELLVLLTQALTLREQFDSFHERVLLQFIPARQH